MQNSEQFVRKLEGDRKGIEDDILRAQSYLQNETFLQKHLKALAFFAKPQPWMYFWVLNTSLEGFVQQAP